jgi:hypothetical protein
MHKNILPFCYGQNKILQMFTEQAITFSGLFGSETFAYPFVILYHANIVPRQQCKSTNKTECTGTIVTQSSIALVPVLVVRNAPVTLPESSE